MTTKQVALYARVSSEQQAEAKTIESQLADLHERISTDGFELSTVLEFVDDGYSGSTLVRPALERLRDVAAAGGMDRLYVHNPDRFARNYAYQVLLLEELTRAGVEVLFLNRALGQTPEDQLLLQVQGVIAEYERAKFLERSRRGKRHAAQQGHVGILCHAPFGYRYVNKQEGGERLALTSALRKHASCNRCLPGLDKTAAPSMRSVAVCTRLAFGRERAKSIGTTRRSGIC